MGIQRCTSLLAVTLLLVALSNYASSNYASETKRHVEIQNQIRRRRQANAKVTGKGELSGEAEAQGRGMAEGQAVHDLKAKGSAGGGFGLGIGLSGLQLTGNADATGEVDSKGAASGRTQAEGSGQAKSGGLLSSVFGGGLIFPSFLGKRKRRDSRLAFNEHLKFANEKEAANGNNFRAKRQVDLKAKGKGELSGEAEAQGRGMAVGQAVHDLKAKGSAGGGFGLGIGLSGLQLTGNADATGEVDSKGAASGRTQAEGSGQAKSKGLLESVLGGNLFFPSFLGKYAPDVSTIEESGDNLRVKRQVDLKAKGKGELSGNVEAQGRGMAEGQAGHDLKAKGSAGGGFGLGIGLSGLQLTGNADATGEVDSKGAASGRTQAEGSGQAKSKGILESVFGGGLIFPSFLGKRKRRDSRLFDLDYSEHSKSTNEREASGRFRGGAMNQANAFASGGVGAGLGLDLNREGLHATVYGQALGGTGASLASQAQIQGHGTIQSKKVKKMQNSSGSYLNFIPTIYDYIYGDDDDYNDDRRKKRQAEDKSETSRLGKYNLQAWQIEEMMKEAPPQRRKQILLHYAPEVLDLDPLYLNQFEKYISTYLLHN